MRGAAEVRQIEELRTQMFYNGLAPSSAPAPVGGMTGDRSDGAGRFRGLPGGERARSVSSLAATMPVEVAGLARTAGYFGVDKALVAGRKAAVEAPPRREVRGEGRWLPSVITGSDGKAVATVPMPESTTAWRLTARGCTVETLVGEAVAQILSRKDFFVELNTPSFVREGDEMRPVGRVHNLTDYRPVALKCVLDAGDKTRSSPSARRRSRSLFQVRSRPPLTPSRRRRCG